MGCREEIWARLIPDLARSPDPIKTILERHGVPRSTYYSRYLKNPEFQRLWTAEIQAFTEELRQERRERREEHFGV